MMSQIGLSRLETHIRTDAPTLVGVGEEKRHLSFCFAILSSLTDLNWNPYRVSRVPRVEDQATRVRTSSVSDISSPAARLGSSTRLSTWNLSLQCRLFGGSLWKL